ncbi:condensation domain-containing protein, partial [Flavivirga jejuensis]|uniref:condensation domain-containing protein n=1 Tax=Flavivirga jejuensis TaxID=870487 RepID=UPI0031E8168F
EKQLSYWEDTLRGVSTISLPTDYSRPSIQSHQGSSVSISLSPELSSSLIALSQKEGVTLFMVLLAAFKVLLSRYSGQDDICIGTPIANRTQSELEGMIGFFVNTLALRSDLSGNPSFREVLGRVKETTLSGYDHQLAPYEKVVDRVVKTRDMSMSPLFQVLFVLQNTPEEATIELEELSLSSYDSEENTSQYDLILNAEDSDSSMVLSMEYCSALFDEVTIHRMLAHYQELLGSIVDNSAEKIGSLSMLRQEEKDELLGAFNNIKVAYPSDKSIVDLFVAQVKNSPDNIAIVF